MLFDTHVNLHGDIYADDLNDVFERAKAANITRMLAICDKIENIPRIQEIVSGRSDLWRSVGCHPHYAKDHTKLSVEELVELAKPADVVGIGETGLDLHYGYSPEDVQKHVFQTHIETSQLTGLPLIVHTREADTQTGDMLEAAMAKRSFPILMHCYTSGSDLARRAVDMDAYFSISGIITFKAAHDVRAVAELFPLDRLILETDCPYLAPVPMRGRRNEPANLVYICEYVAGLLNRSADEVARMTTDNALRLFRRIGQTDA